MDRLLPNMDKELGQNLALILKKQGVKVFTNAMVQRVEQAGEDLAIHFTCKETEETVSGEAVLCAIGRRAYCDGLFADGVGVKMNGRSIAVNANFETSLPHVYAIGDVSLMPDVDPAFPQGHPQLAQVAIQQGRLVARNLSRIAKSASLPGGGNTSELNLKTFKYKDKGSMATIGRNRAVVDMNHGHMSGFMAWLAWMFVHLISLLGMRNKLTVLINWIWAYFNYSTSLRLLIHPCRYPQRLRWMDPDAR